MMLNLILLRMWRERRLMAVLLLGMCLVTAFMALGPLYVQAVAGADFDQRITNAPDSFFQIELRNESPFAEEILTIIEDEVGQYVTAVRSYAAVPSFICGFQYIAGQPLTNESPRTDTTQCYRAYVYENLERYFTLVEGRFPNVLGATSNSTEQIETIISQGVAQETGLAVGSHFIIGEDAATAVTILVTGIFEPALSESHPFWQGQTLLGAFLTPLGNENYRFDVSFVVHPQAFDDWLVNIAGERNYTYKVELNRASLSSQVVNELDTRLTNLQNAVTLIHPNAAVRTSFFDLLTVYRQAIAAASGPITLLSFLVLVLMVYNIITIAALILEQQGEEWAMIASRGGSNLQLVWIQFVTVLLLGIVASTLGAGIAYGILLVLSFVGPQAAILDAARLGGINSQAVVLSLIAGAISVIALTLPAWSAASRSLLRLKHGLSRPPTTPVWSRYMLDVILLALGFGFMVRLYTLSTGAGVMDLLKDPSAFVRVLAQVGRISSLSDPFNLAGPALLLTGAALLWMRIFPMLMRLIASISARGDGLTMRLAFWNVERDPAHYAQLVLLLIGTLALGTASLTLSLTRDRGAWESALSSTGAEGGIVLEPREIDRESDWENLPGVNDALPLLVVPTGSERDGALVGIQLDELDDSFAYLAEPLSALFNQPALDIGGIALPEDTRTLWLDIRSEAVDDDSAVVDVAVSINLIDGLGFAYTVPLVVTYPTTTDEFQTGSAELPAGVPPHHFTGLTIRSTRADADEFQHTIYFDNLMAVDETGQATLIHDFEPDTTSEWQWQQSIRLTQILESTAFGNSEDVKTQGENSMRVQYSAQRSGASVRNVTLNFRELLPQPLPVVVSTAFAKMAGSRSRFNRALRVGDTITSIIVVPSEATASASIEFTFTIVAIIDSFPSFPQESPQFVIADATLLSQRLNMTPSHSNTYDTFRYYDINRLWLDLEERNPSPELIATVQDIAGFREVQFAWVQYTEIQRDPLANSLTGILFAGFWISLLLSLLDFGFYMAVTIRKRALAFATLQAIGWDRSQLLNLLLVEQLAFISPSLIIGVLFGLLLAMLILPFLSLIGGVKLQVPVLGIGILLVVLLTSFTLILRLTASVLRRFKLHEVMRFGE